MIPVIIPTPNGIACDGVLYGNLPTLVDYASLAHSHEPEDDRRVTVVADDALQNLLKPSKAFARFERRFGDVSDVERARINSTFRLIEEWRAGNPHKRVEYLAWMRLGINTLHKELGAKGSPLPESFTDSLTKRNEELVKAQGPARTVSDLLNRRGELRVWWNAQLKTPCPGIFVQNFVEALFVLLLLNLTNPEGVAICPCEKKFTRTKTTQLFCSARCGNKERKARQRSRQRDEEAKRGARKTR